MRDDVITVDAQKCIGCNKCIRVCPVNVANIIKLKEGTIDQFVASVDMEKCINCGECVKACKHGARKFNDSIDELIEALDAGQEIVIIVAPSIKTAFRDNTWKNILYWIKSHGNVRIYDVSFGADICTWAHNKAIKTGMIKKCISQPCPAVVNYIEKYKPDLLNILSPVHSPASCEAIFLRYYGKIKAPIFLLSPCIAKSSESVQWNKFNYNVTFRNIEKYFIEHDIPYDIKQTADFEFDYQQGVLGQLYPRPGGLKDNLLAFDSSLVIRTSEGPHAVYQRIDRYTDVENDLRPDVLDVLNCEYGCNIGTATTTNNTIAHVEGAMDALELEAQKSRSWWLGKDKKFKEFDKKLNLNDFICKYENKYKPMKEMTYEDSEKIFSSMSKDTKTSREINCTSCGYQTCYQMCESIYHGLNVKENCIHYMQNYIKLDYERINNLYTSMNYEISHLKKIIGDISKIVNSMQDKMKTVYENTDSSSEISASMINILNGFSEYFSGITVEHITEIDIENVIKFTDKVKVLLENFKSKLLDNKAESSQARTELLKMTEQIINLKNFSKVIQEKIKK